MKKAIISILCLLCLVTAGMLSATAGKPDRALQAVPVGTAVLHPDAGGKGEEAQILPEVLPSGQPPENRPEANRQDDGMQTAQPYFLPPEQYLAFTLQPGGTQYSVRFEPPAGQIVTAVEIPSMHQGKPVTVIANNAFRDHRTLRSVSIPSTITLIQDNAFYGCTQLLSVTIPDATVRIGSDAFYGTGIWINANADSIVYAYNWAVGYKGIVEAATLTAGTLGIADYAFSGNTELKHIQFSDALKWIGDFAFQGCTALTVVNFPYGLRSIGNSSFWNCTALDNVTLGQALSGLSIDGYAFMEVSALQSITISERATKIGWAPFIYANPVTIYAESTQVQAGWDGNWRLQNIVYYPSSMAYHPVFWGVKLAANKSYVTSFEKKANVIDNPHGLSISAPTRKGYTFAGWYRSSDFTGISYSATAIANASAPNGVYYAKWNVDTYSITYRDVGGSAFSGVLGASYPTIYTYGGTVGLKTPAKTGYTFGGWYLSRNGTGARLTSISGTTYGADVTLYAKWTPASYSITYRDIGGGAFSGMHDAGYPTWHTYGTVTNLKGAAKEGYSFAGWNMSSAGTGARITSIAASYNSDITLYAKWNGTHEIEYRDVGDTAFSGVHGPGYPVTHTYGQNTLLVNPAKTGYIFDGWYTNQDGTGGVVTEIVESKSSVRLFAKWIPETYAIQYKDVGNTAFSGVHGWNHPVTHTYGTVTQLVNPVRTGHTFWGWFLSSNGTGAAVTALPANGYTAAITLYAKWTEETYAIHYKDVGNTAFSGVHGAGYPVTHTFGTATALVNPAKDGYRFAGWFTSSTGTGTAIKVLSAAGYAADITLYAKWTESSVPPGTVIWDGSISAGFAGGNGSQGDPYKIATGGQLARMAGEINAGRGASAWYALTADIYLNDTTGWQNWRVNRPEHVWTPIGTEANAFAGTFSGNGFVIKGVYMDIAGGSKGLFGVVNGGSVNHTGVEESYIQGGSRLGSIAGKLQSGRIVNCYNTGIISSGGDEAGGIVGTVTGGTVSNCYNTALIMCTGYDVGGIAGKIQSGSVLINNYNTGDVHGNNNYNGGIVGFANGANTIEYNYFLKTAMVNAQIGFTTFGNYANNRTFDTTGALMNEAGTSVSGILIGGANKTALIDALNGAVRSSGVLPSLPSGLIYYSWGGTPYPQLQAGTTGLGFRLIANGTAYEVNKGTANMLGTITIPAFYNGLPVTEIAHSAFSNCSLMTGIVIPDTITGMTTYAFRGTGIWNQTADNSIVYAGNWAVGYKGSVQNAIFRSGIVGIAESSFSSCRTLLSVTFPDSLRRIGESAFYYCSNLTGVLSIPASVTHIDSRAFYSCSKISSVQFLTGSALRIGTSAFSSCSALHAILLSDSVESIDTYAFYGCKNITSVTIPSSVSYIGGSAFTGCNLSSINVAEENATYRSESNSVIRISDGMLIFGCKNTVIPEGVTGIGTYAFAHTTVNSIVIPSGVTLIGSDAFSNCTQLASITFSAGLSEIGAYAFQYCRALTAVFLPAGLQKVGNYAFAESGLVGIAIPSSVTSIGTSAFSSCKNLASIMVEGGNTVYRSETNCLIKVSNQELLAGCKTSVIPQTVKRIASYAFRGSKLTAIVIPSGVTDIADRAFENCSDLGAVTFGADSNLRNIGSNAFAGCKSLLSITIPSSVQNLGSYAFSNCSSLTQCVFEEGSELSYISGSLFEYCYNLTEIVIPEGVWEIGGFAFYYCERLESVTFEGSDALTMIGDHAFDGCVALLEITIPRSVMYIQPNAFNSCTGLEQVTFELQSQLLSIEYNAFADCYAVSEIIIPAAVEYVGESAFLHWGPHQAIFVEGGEPQTYSWHHNWNGDCDALIHWNEPYTPGLHFSFDPYTMGYEVSSGGQDFLFLTIPAYVDGIPVTKIADYGFSYCYSLTEVNFRFGSSILVIGEGAFEGCNNLSFFHLPDGVTEIASYAFLGCNSLRSLTIPASVRYIAAESFDLYFSRTLYVEAGADTDSWQFLADPGYMIVLFGCVLSDDKSYVVSYTDTGGNVCSNEYEISPPDRYGYSFGGWTTIQGSDYPEYQYYEITYTGQTLYAIWYRAW